MNRLINGMWIFVLMMSCSRSTTLLTKSTNSSIKDPTSGDSASEINYSGAFMIESIKGEMLAMKYSLAQVNEVVNAAKVEVSLASSLTINAEESSFGLTANSTSLSIAAAAVSNGAVKGLNKPSLPEDAGILFRLGSAARPEQMGLAAIVKGQTKAIANIKSKGKIAGLSQKVVSDATTQLATSAFSSGANSGLITESNASVMVQTMAQNLFGNLRGTSLEHDAEKIIPGLSASLSGLKSLNLSTEGIVLATQSMVAESIAGIKTNLLQSSASELLPMIIQNSITGSFAAQSSLESFSSATAAVAKSALGAVDDLGLITSASEGLSFSSMIFSSTMNSMDQIPDWNIDQLTTVALKVQKSAVEGISDLGLSSNETASILVEATVSMVDSMGKLERFEDLVLEKSTLNQSFNQITAATTNDLKSTISGVTTNFDSVLGQAVEKAAAEGSTPTPTHSKPGIPLPIGIPTGIARISPAQPRANIALVMFQVSSAGVGNTIKFFSDDTCSTYLGESTFTASAVPLSFSLATSAQYHFYAKEFSPAGASSACADTGETYHFDLTTPTPMASLSSPMLPIGSTNIVVLSVSELELGGTIEIYSNNTCTNLLGSQVISAQMQLVTAVLPSNGLYNFFLKQTDDLGNASACQNSSVNYTFDNTPPGAVGLSLFNPAISPSTNSSPMFSIMGTEAGANVGIYSSSSCTIPSLKASTIGLTGTTYLTVTDLSEGTNAFYAQQRDAAGNLSTCSTVFMYQLDTSAPAMPLMALSSGQLPVTALSLVNLNVTVSEPSGTLKLYSDSTCSSFIQSFAVTATIQDYMISGQSVGVHTYYARHADTLNNLSSCSASFASWTQDTTPPPMPVLSGTAPAGPNAAMAISVTGNAEPNSSVSIYSNATCATLKGFGLTNGAGSFAVNYLIPIQDQSYVFYAKAVDAAGNASLCSSTNATYVHNSSIPSVINVTSPNSGTLTTGNGVDINIVFSESVEVTGSPLLQLGFAPGKFASYLSGSGTSTLTFRYFIAAGDNSPDLDYFDQNSLILSGGSIVDFTEVAAQLSLPVLGNMGSLSYNQNIVVDTMSPTMSGISNQTINEDANISGLPLTLSDGGNLISCSSVIASSSNPSLIPPANVIVSGTAPSCMVGLTPVASQFGSSTITLTASDGINTNTSISFVLNVTAVNDDPSISDVSNQPTTEDTPVNNIAVTIQDIDNSLVCATALSATSSNLALLPLGNITFGGTAPNCTVSMNPAINQSGSSTITLTVTDGTLTATDTFVLNVTAVNDTPTISDVSNQITNEDTPLNNVAVMMNDIDNTLVCTTALSVTSSNTTLLPLGNITFGGTAPNCTVSMNPALNQSGASTVTLTATDGTLNGTVSFILTVNPANDIPSISAISENTVLIGSTPGLVPFTISDIDSTVNCSASNISVTSDNTVVIAASAFSVTGSSGNCTLNIDSSSASRGNSLITLTLNDLNGGTGQRLFTLKVIAEWVQEALIKPYVVVTNGDEFGRSVALFGDVLAVGNPFEDSNQTTITNGSENTSNSFADNAGAVYVYKRTGPIWAQEAYLKASNAGTYDWFGRNVSLSGDTLAVSAFQEDSNQTTISNDTTSSSNNSATESGAVYIYKNSGGTWSQQAYIKASNANANDNFGYSLALDGNSLVVGATREASNQTTISSGSTASSNNSLASAGAAYVFGRSGVTWTQQAYLKAANAQANDNFGDTVSLSGNTIAVGAWNEASNDTTITNGTTASADNSATAAGAVYLYRKNAVNWAQEAFIKAKNSQAGDFFGAGIALSGDSLAVGATGESSSQATITNSSTFTSVEGSASSGAVYIYRRDGVTWTHESYIKASNRLASNEFGEKLSLSANMLAVGGYLDDSNQTTITNGSGASANTSFGNAGAAYIFKRMGASWSQIAYLKAPNANADDYFGFGVSLSNDTLAVGAPLEDSIQNLIINGPGGYADNSKPESGAAYVFRNLDRLVDPHFMVSEKTATSITFVWPANLGSATQVKIAPASSGGATPSPCSDAGSTLLTPGTTSYTYSGLSAATQYGFRICSYDGLNLSQGSVIWERTN